MSNNAHHQGISPFVCACFTLNYLIGTGFLTLPWAFDVSGILLSSITMGFTCLIASIASDYILTAMARAEAATVLQEGVTDAGLTKARVNDVLTPLTRTSDTEKPSYSSVEPENVTVRVRELTIEFDVTTSTDGVDTDDKISLEFVKKHGKLLVGSRKFELTELCQIFLGQTGLMAYGISASLDIYGFLWAYGCVFGDAMAQLLPLGFDDAYGLWLAVFACIVVPLSTLNLSEQAILQVFLSGCRIVMVLLMIFTPLAAAVFGSGGDPTQNVGPVPHFDQQTEPVGAVWCDFSNFQKMFPAIVFSVLFHQAVPGLADEMTNKREVGVIFGYTFLLCGLAYTLLGVVGAWYFGELIYESANINWGVYHGGTGTFFANDNADGTWAGVSIWAQFIRLFVVSFPAIDVISVFPIYGYVLGNTLVGLVHANNIQEMQHNRRVLTFYRLVAAVPPILAAYFVRELGVITDYSGLVGLAIAFCFPPLLYIQSEKRLKKMRAPFRTRYERLGTSSFAAMAMFGFGVISIVYCFILLSFWQKRV